MVNFTKVLNHRLSLSRATGSWKIGKTQNLYNNKKGGMNYDKKSN